MAVPSRPPPQIVAVTPGEPFDVLTWSGLSRHLLLALRETGALAGAVNGRSRPIDLLEKASTFSPSKDAWRQRHGAMASPIYPLTRALMSRLCAQRIRRVDPHPDVVLQIGARHDFSAVPRLPRRLTVACNGGNFAQFLRRPDLAFTARDRHVRRVLEYERRVHDGVDLIICWSEWLRESFVEDFGQDPGKVAVVGAGANLDRIPEPVERELEPPRLLFIGKHFVRKGGPQVLAAFERVRAEIPEAELWLVGEDRPSGPAGPGVRWFGRVYRNRAEGEALIDRLYREATTFVMPSLYEPFGVVFLEAMAYGLPCVGADTCAMPEIIEDGVTGFVVSPGETEPLAARLLELGRDPALARSMGAAGRERLLERFTWRRVAHRIVEEIDRRLDAA